MVMELLDDFSTDCTICLDPTEDIKFLDLKEIEKFMDGNYDCDSPVPLSRGPNPYLGGERCLLCRCERPDPPQAATIKQEADDKNKSEDSTTLSAIPLWVCPNCRRTVEEVEKKAGLSSLDTSFLDQDFTTSLPFLPEMNLGPSSQPNDPNSVNGNGVCTCDACTERRQIEAEHERETEELQKCWMELRKAVWLIYYRNGDEGVSGHPDPQLALPDEERITQLVHRLCSRDPHQLFRRLESQAREFVLEKKVTLLRRLSEGHKTPAEARSFVERLLDEYSQLCRAANRLAGLLTELEKVHLKKFKVTWELHNKHLFQSIAYTDPLVQKSLPILIKQLRQGAASKETYHEDSYPGLLQRYLKFDDEMSVVNVVWRDCQQLIELYNEEQEALKVKQKMLKEDWEFFKEQRKLLEQQVLKRSSNQSANSPQLKCTAGLEAQFTETMRNLLQGTKPTPEECHCPKCNRKRCPCDECTITHMITCGIINPDSVENAPQQPPNFSSGGHECGGTGSSYIDDVTPPSMSSSSSSSGPSSPLLSHPDSVNNHYHNGQQQGVKSEADAGEDDGESGEEEASQSDSDGSDDDYDDDDDDIDDEDDEDCDEDEDDASDEELEPPVGGECPPVSQGSDCSHSHHSVTAPPDYPPPQPTQIPLPPVLSGWPDPQLSAISAPDTTGGTDSLVNACDCHHCVSQAKAQQEEGQCQCHVCLQQQGKMVTTSLPQPLPAAPRPELHLYPHIHGHSNRIQPQLYDLHNPIHQVKPATPPAKVPLKLDFDTPEGLQEHMYHAFGEWDNTYSATRMLLDSHKYSSGLGTELLPPPPLPTSGPFISEALSMDGSAFVSPLSPSNVNHSQPTSMMAPTRPFDTFSSGLGAPMSQPPVAQTESCQKATMRRSNRNALNKQQAPSQGQMNRILPPLTPMPPVSRPATMGGNSVAQPPDDKMQRCKHNITSQSKMPVAAAQHNVNHAAMTSGGHTVLRNSDARQAVPRKDDAKLTTGGGGNLNLNPNHSCSHSHSRGSGGGHMHPSGGCLNALPPPPNGNVSVGTCMDPDCETHHDDNYDSIDDSGSEQSSSTSTSNQKEGKYCDCCYCEFFGHSNPPSVPTSKNYPEMRDRLRLRLKRKNELKQDDGPKPIDSVCRAKPQQHKDPLESKGVDELVKFINGVEEPKDKQLTAKAAKRARQKQRKAEERAKKIEEERQKLRQVEQARIDAAKAFSRAQQASNHCAKKDFINLHKEVLTPHEPTQPIPIEQRKKKKPRTKASVIRDDPSKDKSPGQENKTPMSNAEQNAANPSMKTVQSVVSKDTNHVSRQSNSAPNNVISERKTAQSQLLNKQPCAESPKLKPAEKVKNGENPSPAKPATPASPRQIEKRASATKKVSSPAPTVTSAPPKFTPTINTSPLSNGTVQFTAQPSKPLTPNNAKKGGKKASGQQVQQNNLNNLNATIQSPITKNGLVIQADNYQINGQRWTVTPTKDKTKPAPVVSKPSTPPVSNPAVKPAGRVIASPVKSRPNSATEQILRSAEQALQNQEQNKLQTGKNKKKNKKNRNNEDSNHIDEIFLPRTDSDLEGGEMDDFERELEEFKRFCFDSTPAPRQKLQVNVNLKDIFAKKKSGLGCS